MTEQNAFAPRAKLPSVSWANATPGTTITGRVIDTPTEVQARDFQSGALATWDNGDPKMNVVTHLDVDGEQMALWCVRPSALYGAIVEAVQRVGASGVDVGGWLKVTYVGDKPSERPGMNAARQFTAEYSAPNAFSGGGNGQQAQPTQQQGQRPSTSGGWASQRPTQQPAQPEPAYAPQQPAQQDDPPF